MTTIKKEAPRKSIAVRISEAERQILKEKAELCGCGDNVSAYIRQCALSQQGIQVVYKDREIMDLLYEMDSELKKIEESYSRINVDKLRKGITDICATLNV